MLLLSLSSIMPPRLPTTGHAPVLRDIQRMHSRRPRILLPSARSVTRSNPSLYPPPTHGNKVLASLNGGPVDEMSHLVAPDSKTEAKVPFYTRGRVLRSVLYTSLGIATSAVFAFAGLHLWVEQLELPPGSGGARASPEEEELYGFTEGLEGWGAAYAGGGTDSRIGWKARALVRAAWVASHWQTGQHALSKPATEIADEEDEWVVDSGFAIAEARLEQALLLARKRGLKLDQNGRLDKGLMELETQLASICERINTPVSLTKAYQVYERLWQACASIADQLGKEGKDCWEVREGMRIATRLGDVGLKLSTSDLSLNPLSAVQAQQSAEQYLIWCVTQGLGLAVGDGEGFRKMPATHDRNAVAKRGGIFTFFTKSKQPLTKQAPSSASTSQSLKVGVALIEASLDALNQLPPEKVFDVACISAAASRAAISALARFIVHLVTVDVNLAYSLQQRMHGVLQKAVAANASVNSPDANLYQNWLKTRKALAAVYLAELGYSTNQLKGDSVVDLCQSALRSLDSVLAEQRFLDDEVFKRGGTRSTSGRLAEQTHQLRQEARMTGVMASNILGFLFENCPADVTKESLSWCGSQPGCLSAQAFFMRALQYADSTTTSNGMVKDSKIVNLWNQSQHHLNRVRQNTPSLPSGPTSSQSSSPVPSR